MFLPTALQTGGDVSYDRQTLQTLSTGWPYYIQKKFTYLMMLQR